MNFYTKVLAAVGLAKASVIELTDTNTPQMALPGFQYVVANFYAENSNCCDF